MYATHPHFQQTNIVGAISEGTGGVTEAYKQRVVMPFSYSYEETDHVLGHELVHAFQYDISGLGRAGGGLDAAAAALPGPALVHRGNGGVPLGRARSTRTRRCGCGTAPCAATSPTSIG